MSVRRLTTAIAAGGLLMTFAAGQRSQLRAQDATIDADANIVREVTVRNMFELRTAEIAGKKSSNAAVKGFAGQMQTDHMKINDRLTALVGRDGKPFRIGLGNTQTLGDEVKRLDKLSGVQFDQEYMRSMVAHHQDNVSYFQSAANTAQSSQVRQLLASGLPVLRQHLSMAIQVSGQVGAAPPVAIGPAVPADLPASTPTVPASQNPPVANQNVPEVTKKDRDDLKKDKKFVQEAVADNTLEIRLAQVAQKNATSSDARRLATYMLSDHTAMQKQWLDLAARHGMKLTAGMGRHHLEKAKRLESTPAADFDRTYITMEVQNNQDYAEYFQKEGAASHSAQVRTQAANDLLSIRRHLAGAKKVANLVGVDTAAALRARNLSSYRK
ncbi:MAG: DUF4142 domain-containing protein [Gemmatimonadales bacterium]